MRRTICVGGRAHYDDAVLHLARSAESGGAQPMPPGAIVARLAGGFAREATSDSVLAALADILGGSKGEQLGDLAAIADLPGFRRAVTSTLTRAWHAGFDLSARSGSHPRIAALARVERLVLQRLPPAETRPAELVAGALARIRHAPAVLGDVEVRRMPDIHPCWRPLFAALPSHVRVTWDAGVQDVPSWAEAAGFEVIRLPRSEPSVATVSCANPRHEVVEAVRWARCLMAAGDAGPQDIAFAAVSMDAYDDFLRAAADETLLPIHFAHGRPALDAPDGQTAAALAEAILRGPSRERVRRLVARLRRKGGVLERLPADWATSVPSTAALPTAARWRAVLTREPRAEVRDALSAVVELLETGPGNADAIGEALLRGKSRLLWRRALEQAPGAALEGELRRLRFSEGEPDPAASIAWMPASALASCPRPHVWLFGLNAQSWPRPPTEDPILPDRLLGGARLAELTVAEADRRTFAAIMGSTERGVVRSFSRREAGGRRLGVSPLLAGASPEHLSRTRVPPHAMSEPDRMMARPSEFATTAAAASASACWTDWRSRELTAHDGVVSRRDHPAIVRALEGVQSARSLTLLLRNPIGFMWRHALGLTEPATDDEPLELTPVEAGQLVHDIVDAATRALGRGLSSVDAAGMRAAVERAAGDVGVTWEAERTVPPRLLWERVLSAAGKTAVNAMLYPYEGLDAPSCWSEVPFGVAETDGRDSPWDVTAPVPIPGTGMRIEGRIDRLDVSGDGSRARVVDYKTGTQYPGVVLRGGRELQRCLYAFAASALIGGSCAIDTGLLFPSQGGDPADGTFAPLDDPSAVLLKLGAAVATAADNLRQGNALPGIAAGTRYADTRNLRGNAKGESDPMAFALPVLPGATLGPKKAAARVRLGALADFWDEP